MKPLTLGELEAFFNGAWSIYEELDCNFADDGYDLDEMQDFVVSVDSEFYRDLDALYRRRIATWAAERQPEDDVDGALPTDARQP